MNSSRVGQTLSKQSRLERFLGVLNLLQTVGSLVRGKKDELVGISLGESVGEFVRNYIFLEL